MQQRTARPTRFHPQRGSTLIFGMLLMLILTILGVAASGTANLELKMSANELDKGRSFQEAEDARTAAESAAIQAADAINAAGGAAAFNCGNVGIFAAAGTAYTTGCNGLVADPRAHDWVNNAIAVDGIEDRYIVEYLGVRWVKLPNDPNRDNPAAADLPVHAFRLTVRGLGVDGAVTVVQATYSKVCTIC